MLWTPCACMMTFATVGALSLNLLASFISTEMYNDKPVARRSYVRNGRVRCYSQSKYLYNWRFGDSNVLHSRIFTHGL
ncbi:hypothetical protein F5Y12DRAFT_731395 [Xylaria sp. FL1777]|nr:hypothetical protein F5Y12DRAFT_731395 [Xylaria sp. FL1777]